MEPFESDGLFWLPDDEANRVAGRISFDPSKGVLLSLIGSFSETDFGEDFHNPISESVIHGVAGKRFLTLINCRRVSGRFESPGFQREDYRAESLFAGMGLLDPDDLRFDQVTVEFNSLFDWMSQTAVSREYIFGDSSKKLEKVTLTLDAIPAEEISAEGFKVAITSSWKILGSTQNPGFEQDFSLRITYDHEVDYSKIKHDISSLQDLLTALTGSAAVPTGIGLWVPDADEIGSKSGRTKVSAYGQQSAHSMVKANASYDVLLNYQQAGGLQALTRWLEFTRGRRIVLGLSLSSRYRQMYVENKFFNSVSAAETLHRMEFPNEVRPAGEYKNFRRMLASYVPKKYRGWLSQQLAYSNEPRLRDRLRELAEFGQLSNIIGCEPVEWAAAVTKTRNRMVHHDKGKGPGASSADLYWLSESLQLLVLICLMRFCEFKDGYLGVVKSNDSVQFIAERVQEILSGEESV
ncbi:ApeA N-terminal domain 1-containing protein [Streptomyces decoyicus]